jgi:hypothetical protein
MVLSPEIVTDRPRAPEPTGTDTPPVRPARQVAVDPEASPLRARVAAALRATRHQLALGLTILWLAARLAALAAARLIAWFAADPHRPRAAGAGLAVAAAVGAVVGVTVGYAVGGAWSAVRAVVLDDMR